MSDILKAIKDKIPAEKRDEILKKVASCKDPESIIAKAKEEGVDLSADEAKAILATFSEKVAISEEDLDKASGGCSGCFDYEEPHCDDAECRTM